MLKIAFLQHETLYDDMPLKEETNAVSFVLIDALEDIAQEELDFLFIPKDDALLASLDPSLYRQVILVDKAFTVTEIRHYFRLGVHDCIQLPVSWEAYVKELTSIARANKRKDQQEKLRKKYATDAMKESLAYDLLHGKTKNARQIWERSKLANLSHIPNVVLLLSIDHFLTHVENKGEYWKNSIREEVLQAMEAFFQNDETLIVLVNQSQFAILVALPVQLEIEKYQAHSRKLAKRIRDAVSEKTDYSVTIGIGNVYEDARNLHLSFEESEYAQSYRLYSNENAIIHVAEIDYYDTPAYEGFKTDIKEIADLFVKTDLQVIKERWQTSFKQVVTQKLDPASFRLQVVDLLFSISKAAIQHGANPKQIMPLQIKYAKQLYEVETLDEMEATIFTVLEEYVDHMHENQSESSLKLVQEVLMYMDAHYASDISLDMLAEEVSVSPNYLSHLFKQTTGSSFVDYLTELRMKHAKEMLADLHLTVYEIAIEVGYRSSQYFSRVFKKHTDVTPTQYRNNLLQAKSTNNKSS